MGVKIKLITRMKNIILLILLFSVSQFGTSQKNAPSYHSRKIVTSYISRGKINVTEWKKRKGSKIVDGHLVKVKSTVLKIDSLSIYSEDGKSYSLSFSKGYTDYDEWEILSFYQNKMDRISFSVPRDKDPVKASVNEKIAREFKTALVNLYTDYKKYAGGEIDPFYIERADSLLSDFKAKFTRIQKEKIQSGISEEQRKYIVQANALNEEKNYDQALEFLEIAIQTDPFSYPEAYYNMALIAAQVEDYAFAVFNMKKYLILMPDAGDARAAQDKIYEWEYKINKN
jgi:tetratricopeptide (TPR) repeat protein